MTKLPLGEERVLESPAVGGTRRSASLKGSNMAAQGNALGKGATAKPQP